MRINETTEANKIDENLHYVGMNESGNLVYVLKPEPGTSNPELYFVIDLANKQIYEKCFADASERMETPEIKKLHEETKNKFAGANMLKPSDAVKRIGDLINKLEKKPNPGLRINHKINK